MNMASSTLGTVCVVLGTIFFLMVCGDLIVRLILALGALYLINYGLTLQGSAPLTQKAQVWMVRYWQQPPRYH